MDDNPRQTISNARSRRRAILMRQFMESLTPEQRLMLREACTNSEKVEKILTQLVIILTPELLKQIESNVEPNES